MCVYVCSLGGIGFVEFIRGSQRSVTYKRVSKRAHPEGKQEGRGKADVKYILLAYHMHLYVLYINICIFCPKDRIQYWKSVM